MDLIIGRGGWQNHDLDHSEVGLMNDEGVWRFYCEAHHVKNWGVAAVETETTAKRGDLC